jgi:hypothetical protein
LARFSWACLKLIGPLIGPFRFALGLKV